MIKLRHLYSGKRFTSMSRLCKQLNLVELNELYNWELGHASTE